ncbi:hypothetical protein [Clostridium estertheticum]|uniref:hypothetical protein n=1 Tax=Clostridium estertheticum TaxID=238834 RepID=UPI00124F55D5|nr:hypothetical protein [Clostridium estertheticum]MBZ9616789.1 hypothetical protein [Clostridium estertheticum subsp. laramiense]WAG72496.1 hypothetical protein LL032_15225 [Clostridium estertheticum]
MKKIICKQNNLSRQDLANPFRNMSYHERLVKARIVDIKDNFIVENLGNGYERVKVVDESKLVE